jgi:predicted Ser/Thr protein kinase
VEIDALIGRISSGTVEEFQRRKRILSFREFLDVFSADPVGLSRTAPQYIADVFDHWGSRQVRGVRGPVRRFSLFDCEFDRGLGAVYGQEDVQNEVYAHLRAFASAGRPDRIIMLHGPNGSSKTSLVACIIRAMEHYSQLDKGAMYSFNWVFADREASSGRMGFEKATGEPSNSLAHADGTELTCRIPCEMKDNPLLLIPPPLREELLDVLAKESGDRAIAEHLGAAHLRTADICPKCRAIYDTLLVAYGGDWKRVCRHVQVERFFVSKRYRMGAVTVEPQGVPDAGVESYMPDRMASLPDVLGGLQLYAPAGDLVDANRGLIEYSDFLKRPLEANKYLLATSEQGVARLPRFEAHLDLVMIATVNELQLTAFKAHPDFNSFRGRLELVACPYLLECSKEEHIYESHLRNLSRGRHTAPRTAQVAALWAVLTRMRKPDPAHFEGAVASAAGKLKPLEKARFYDDGRLPTALTANERRELAAAAAELADEYREQISEFEGAVCANYEGRWGASPRELRLVLSEVSSERATGCLTPLVVLDRIERLTGQTSSYEFLRVEPEGGYGDASGFVELVRGEYCREIWADCCVAAGLVNEDEFARLLADYFIHVRAFAAGDRVQNPANGKWEEPNRKLLESVEKHLDIEGDVAEFRRGLITRAAAWSLDHPGEKMDCALAFSNIREQIRRSSLIERLAAVRSTLEGLLRLDTEDQHLLGQEQLAASRRTMDGLCSLGYCPVCAKEVAAFALRNEDKITAADAG